MFKKFGKIEIYSIEYHTQCSILVIDTCLNPFIIALSRQGKLYEWKFDPSVVIRSTDLTQWLPDIVANLAEAANCKLSDIEVLCVPKGPGSFTGIRIALSFAQGLFYVMQNKIFSPTSFEVLAWQSLESEKTLENLKVLINTQQNSFYQACYYKKDKKFQLGQDIVMVSVEDAFQGTGPCIMDDRNNVEGYPNLIVPNNSKTNCLVSLCNSFLNGDNALVLHNDIEKLTPYYFHTPQFKKKQNVI